MTEDVQEIDADDIAQEDIVDADPVAQEEQPAEPEWSAEDEEEARLFGWKSPDEWQGEKPAGYIGKPDEFLERVQRSRIFKAMQEKQQTIESQAAEIARKQEVMNQRAIERQREQHEAELRRITEAQRKAVYEADTEAYDHLEKQKQDLHKSSMETQDRPDPDPLVVAYRESEQGAWLKNPILHRTAAELIERNDDILRKPAKDQLAFAEAEIRKMYPAYFPQADPAKPAPRATVDGGGLAAGGGSRPAGAFGKLPGEAKASFARFVKEGLYKDSKEDREEFANEYNRA